MLTAHLFFRVSDKSVLCLFQRREDRRAICNDGLLETSILHLNLRTNSSAGKDRQAYRRPGGKKVPHAQRNVVQLRSLPPRRSQEEKTREEFCFGLTHACCRRNNLCLSLPNIRPALQQLRRQTNGDLGWSHRYRSAGEEFRAQSTGLFAQQNTDAMNRGFDATLQCRDRRPGGLQLGRGPYNIELRCQSRLRSRLSQMKSVLLDENVLVRNIEPKLKTSQLCVRTPELSQDRNQHGPARFCRCSSVRAGRLQSSAYAPEDIHLPRSIKATLEVVELDRNDLR